MAQVNVHDKSFVPFISEAQIEEKIIALAAIPETLKGLRFSANGKKCKFVLTSIETDF